MQDGCPIGGFGKASAVRGGFMMKSQLLSKFKQLCGWISTSFVSTTVSIICVEICTTLTVAVRKKSGERRKNKPLIPRYVISQNKTNTTHSTSSM